MWEVGMSLCSQVSIRRTKYVKHTGLSLQKEGGITCHLPRRLGTGVVNNLVTCEICVTKTTSDLPPDPYHEFVNL